MPSRVFFAFVPLLLATGAMDFALAQSIGGGGGAGNAVAYCTDLRRVTVLALTKERFATIAGSSREGSFLDTTLPLSGWKDCSLYGSRTYTCDSHDLGSADEAA